MSQKPLLAKSAILATKEKLKDRFLYVGKVSNEQNPNVFVFYLIEILSPWFPSTKVEKTISNQLINDININPNFSDKDLENTFQAINKKLGDLTRQGDSDWVGNLNALIGLIENNKLHLSMTGSIVGYLLREGKVVCVTEGLSSNDEANPYKTFINITSGAISQKDKIILANIKFYDFLSIERLRRITSDQDVKQAMSEIHKMIRKSQGKEANALLLEVLNPEKEVDDSNLPDIFYTDQASDTFIHKFIKKATPVAKSITFHTKEISKKAYYKTKKSTQTAKEKWHKKYGPDTKKFISHSGQKAKEVMDKISRQKSFQDPKPKIKSYHKTTSKFVKIISKYGMIVLNSLQKLLKNENRRYLYIGLIIILVIFGYFKVRSNNLKRQEINKQQEIVSSLGKANELYSQGKEDIALGREGGEKKLAEALKLANEAKNLPAISGQANQLINDITILIDEIIKAVRVKDIAPIFSLNSDVKISVLVGSSIYSITNEGKIYSTDTRDNQPALIASINEDSGEVTDFTFASKSDTVFIYTNQRKIFSLDVDTDTILEINVDDNSEWEEANAISSYVTNLYLLDSASGEVWKHSKSDSGFSKGTAYLDTRNVSIKESIDLAIDGNIYVLKNDSSVAKFVRGSFDSDFSLKDIPSPYQTIDSPVQIYTDQDTNYLYILDNAKNRILRFEKSGYFANQFIFDNIMVDEFFVNPRVQKMWIRSGKDYYEMNL